MQQYGGGGAASSYVGSTLYNQPYAAYPPPHNTNNRFALLSTQLCYPSTVRNAKVELYGYQSDTQSCPERTAEVKFV